MKAENEFQLQAIMEQFEQKMAKSKDTKDKHQSDQETFYVEFKRIRTEIIRPAMNDIGAQLTARGHRVEISEAGDERSKRDAKITLRVTIGGLPSSVYTPENSLVLAFANTGHQTVAIQATTPSQRKSDFSAPRGTYTLAEITTDLVEKKILEVLGEVFCPGLPRA